MDGKHSEATAPHDPRPVPDQPEEKVEERTVPGSGNHRARPPKPQNR